jgi:hypothetical protein
MPTLLTVAAVTQVARWEIGPIRDQGVEGACVGFGCKALLEASPFRQSEGPSAREIYLEARIIDEFDDNEVQEGTSVRAGLNVLKGLGLIQSYVWATGVEDVYRFLSSRGPVVAGMDWYGYSTDSDGRMRFTGTPVGGHCILLTGYSLPERKFTFQNSWGSSFGINGEGYITESDLARQLTKGGTCAGIIEKPRV